MVIHAHNILSEMPKINAIFGTEGPMATEFDMVKDALSSSAKFDLGALSPPEAIPLLSTGIEYLKEGLLPLPYPNTYFEFTEALVEGHGERWWGLLIHPDCEYPGAYALRGFGGRHLRKRVTGGSLDLSLIPRPYRLVLFKKGGRYCFSDFIAETAPPPHTVEPAAMNALKHAEKSAILLALHAGLALLSSPAVSTAVVPAPEKLNRRRLKKGKAPLFSYHVLTIGGRSTSGKLIAPGNKRVSPRKHWRRGHVRVYRRGETNEAKTIIPPALIGYRGFVSKEYKVRRQGADETNAASQLSPSKEP